jgi:hypothetical protein
MAVVQASKSVLPGLKWFGTATGLVGALVLALNLPISGWGWVLFAVSSASWTAAGLLMRETSLVLLQGGFLVVDLIGVWRWLID